MFNYYTMADEQEMRFYQFPKALLSNDRYKTLSHGAKIAYTVFRDRQDLSRKNNWVDENGCIYLIFTNEHMAKILNVTEKTVISYKKELSDHDLLKERRMGLGRPNRIYIGKTNDEYESPQVNTTVQTSNDYRSRQVNTPALKLTLGKGNDTEFNETDVNDTNTSKPPATKVARKSNKFDENSIEFILADNLYKSILSKDPKCKKPNLDEWATHIDRLHRIDGRDFKEIKDVMEWTVRDSFWSTVILSTRNFRDKFTQLKIQMEKDRPKNNYGNWNEKKQENIKAFMED